MGDIDKRVWAAAYAEAFIKYGNSDAAIDWADKAVFQLQLARLRDGFMYGERQPEV